MWIGEAFPLLQQGPKSDGRTEQFALTTLSPNKATNYIPKKLIITDDNHTVSLANIAVHYILQPKWGRTFPKNSR